MSLAEDRPAGRDRRLRELQLAHVALREEDVVGEVEDRLLADLVEPVRASPTTNLPLASRMPAPTSSATASTSPEPQRPTGSTSPITVSSTSPSRIFTPSIAPSAARIPQRICAASNAGPAGAAHASASAEEPSTISEFVPTSMKRRSAPVERQPGREHARRRCRGRRRRRAPGRARPARAGGRATPKSAAVACGQRARRDRERRHRERLGVDPERDLDHRHVAGDDDLVDLARLDAALLAAPPRSARRASRARARAARRARPDPSSPPRSARSRRRRTAAACSASSAPPRAGPSRGRAGSRRRSSCRGRTRARSGARSCRPARRRSARRRRAPR